MYLAVFTGWIKDSDTMMVCDFYVIQYIHNFMNGNSCKPYGSYTSLASTIKPLNSNIVESKNLPGHQACNDV